MSRCDTTEQLQTTPSKVWAQFQPERMKRWYGPEIHPVTAGPLGKGSKIRVTGRSGAKTYGYDATITDYVENRSIAWEGEDRQAKYRVAFLMTPKDGYTLILMRDEFRLKGPLGWLFEKLFVIRRVAKYDRHFLGQLKRIVEEA